MPTLPKRLFPARLNRLKAVLYCATRRAAPRLSAFPRALAAGAAAPPLTPAASVDVSLEDGAGGGGGAAGLAAAVQAPPCAEGCGTKTGRPPAEGRQGEGGRAGLGPSLGRALHDIEARARGRLLGPGPPPAEVRRSGPPGWSSPGATGGHMSGGGVRRSTHPTHTALP
jgi:hypothetical protein